MKKLVLYISAAIVMFVWGAFIVLLNGGIVYLLLGSALPMFGDATRVTYWGSVALYLLVFLLVGKTLPGYAAMGRVIEKKNAEADDALAALKKAAQMSQDAQRSPVQNAAYDALRRKLN